MKDRFGRAFLAAVVALFALLIANWFDAGVLRDAQLRAGHTYDFGSAYDLTPVAHMLAAAGAVAIAVAGWWSRTLLLGVCYAIVGGVLVFLPALFWAFGLGPNGAQPTAPQPIADLLNHWYTTLAMGVVGAVYTLGGAMFLTGLAVIWSGLRDRRRGGVTQPATTQVPQTEPEPLQP